jgi:DNA topoisomerase-3
MKIKELFICEKPSQAKSIATAFGWKGGHKGNYIQNGDQVITWAIGHLLSQAPPQTYEPELKVWQIKYLPIVPNSWIMNPPDKKNPKEKSKYDLLMGMDKLIKNSENVIIATDFDNEGETIACEILDFFGYTGATERMIYSAMDKKSLMDAYNNRVDGKTTYGKYLAGLGRMRADWLMGMNITMALTTSNNKFLTRGDVLSAGRVQSPIIYLIVRRENEIKAFNPVDHYAVSASFLNNESKSYLGNLKLEESWCNEDGLFTNKVKANSIANDLQGKQGTITNYKVALKETKCPNGYTLDELQRDGINKFGLSAQNVLDIAQSLYETHKVASYPRSDSAFMPVNQFRESQGILNAIKSNMNNSDYDNMVSLANPKLKSEIWNDKKVSAHHAIVPINNNCSVSKLSKDEQRIYDLICKRYLMQFLGNYKFESTKITTKVDTYTFETSGNVPKFKGWKLAGSGEKDKETILPELKKGEVVDITKTDLKAKKTKPPAYYTEATLLSDMENVQKYIQNEKLKKIIKKGGIGTPATRAAHLENLFGKNYIKKEGKKVRATAKAFAINSILPDKIRLPETTAYWEEELNKIVDGKQTLENFMSKQDTILNQIVSMVKEQKCQLKEPVSGKSGKIYKCDKCGGLTEQVKIPKTGDKLWVCGDDECKTWYKDNRGKRGEIIIRTKQPDQPDGDFPCIKCNAHQMLLRKSKNGNLFWVCSDDKCKTFANDKNGKPVAEVFEKCEKCTKQTLIRRKKKDGSSHFWVCSDDKCKTFASDVNGKPVFDKTEKCFECNNNTLVRRKKKNAEEHFWVCSDKKCGVFANDNGGTPVQNQNKPKEKQTSQYSCPKCKSGSLIKRNSSNGAFWSCNNFPKCKTNANDKNGSPEI